MRKMTVCTLLLPLLVLGGCPAPAPPLPEAVLEGTWELTGDALPAEITDYLVTFNEVGEITRISFRYNEIVTVTVSTSSSIDSSSTVSGSDVSIVASWFTVNNLVFSGTLNEALTQMTGSASYRLEFGGVTIETPVGDAVFTKQ